MLFVMLHRIRHVGESMPKMYLVLAVSRAEVPRCKAIAKTVMEKPDLGP